MAAQTISELYTELSIVNTAIQQVISGDKVTELRVGSGDFVRQLKFTDTPLQELLALRESILNKISILEPATTPVFRNNACIPLVCTK